MANYSVIVGNVGTVYDGTSSITAWMEWHKWVDQSTLDYGRAAGESVIEMRDGEIIREHIGRQDSEDNDG